MTTALEFSYSLGNGLFFSLTALGGRYTQSRLLPAGIHWPG